MSMRGMDVERVEHLVGQLELQAHAIDTVVLVVDSAVTALTQVWFGADVLHFHGAWQGAQRGHAQSAAQDLHTAVAELRRQVSEQRSTSALSTGSVLSGTPGHKTNPAGLLAFAHASYGEDPKLPDGWKPLDPNSLEKAGLSRGPPRSCHRIGRRTFQ